MVRATQLHIAGSATDSIRPNWILLLLIFIIPLQNIYIGRIPSLGGGLNLLNALVVISFLVWRGRKDLAIPTETSVSKPLIYYMLALTVSVFTRTYTLGSFDFKTIQALKDVLIAVFLFFIVLNSVRDRKGIIKVLIASFLPLPYMFHVFRHQFANVASRRYTDDLRLVNGTFMELGSNELAAFYAAYTLLIISLIIFVKNMKLRLILAALTAINLYCLLYSYSRGAYLSFTLGVLAVGWHLNRKLVITLLPVVLVFGAAILQFLPGSVQERVDSIFVTEEEERDFSAESRFELWGYAFDSFLKNPVLGTGYETFIHRNPLNKDAHNYFVKTLADQGLFGFVALLAIFWSTLNLSLSLYRESSDPLYTALGLGMLGITVCLFSGNMFGDRFSHYPLSSYFYVYLALCARALILVRNNSSKPIPGV